MIEGRGHSKEGEDEEKRGGVRVKGGADEEERRGDSVRGEGESGAGVWGAEAIGGGECAAGAG